MSTDPDHDDDDESSPPYPRSLGEYVRYLRYTLFPTMYTDEDSTPNDLRWQQVLELRGIRYWLAALSTVLFGLLVLLVAVLVAP